MYSQKCHIIRFLWIKLLIINMMTRLPKNFWNYPIIRFKNQLGYVTPNEINITVENLPNKKTPHHDRATNLVFKKLTAKWLVFMTLLFNFIRRFGYFSLKWKIVTAVFIKREHNPYLGSHQLNIPVLYWIKY